MNKIFDKYLSDVSLTFHKNFSDTLVGSELFGSRIVETTYHPSEDVWRLKTEDGKQHVLTQKTVHDLVVALQLSAYKEIQPGFSQHSYISGLDFVKKITMKEMTIAKPIPDILAGHALSTHEWDISSPFETITVGVEAEIDINKFSSSFIEEFTAEEITKAMLQAQKEAEYFTAAAMAGSGSNLNEISTLVPGLKSVWAGLLCPSRTWPRPALQEECAFRGKQTFVVWVMHLNDQHQWPWKKIIDWMKFEGVDLTVREEVKKSEDSGEECCGYPHSPINCTGHNLTGINTNPAF